MTHYTNTFMGHTTVVVEIEETLPAYQLNYIVDMLDELADGLHTHSAPLKVINQRDEDVTLGHRLVVLSQHNPETINSIISDIAEIVSTGKLLTLTGVDLLAEFRETV